MRTFQRAKVEGHPTGSCGILQTVTAMLRQEIHLLHLGKKIWFDNFKLEVYVSLLRDKNRAAQQINETEEKIQTPRTDTGSPHLGGRTVADPLCAVADPLCAAAVRNQ